MKYTAKPTVQFKKDVKRMQKQNKDMQLLWDVVEKLANGISLPDEYRDHMLSGNFKEIRECHIQNRSHLYFPLHCKENEDLSVQEAWQTAHLLQGFLTGILLV